MSIYGGIKRIDDTVFKFDRIYRSRTLMDENAATDGVYIGRYVLVEYGERYHSVGADNQLVENSGDSNIDNNPNPPTKEEKEKLLIKGLDFILTKDVAPQEGKKYYTLKEDGKTINLDSWPSDGLEYFDSNKEYYEIITYSNSSDLCLYKEHRIKDQEVYHNTFDSTVWLKIYSGSTEKYIMVAELNAMIPKMTLIPISSLRYLSATDDEEEEVYNRDNEKIENVKSEFISPSFDRYNIDTELEYRLYMPKPLELDVQDENVEYNQLGFDIAYSNALVKEINGEEEIVNDNFIHWVPILEDQNALSNNDVPAEINRKELYMSLPGIGNLMKDLYDLLYGKPRENHDIRPFFQEYRDTYEPRQYNNADRAYDNDDEAWLANVPTIGDILANNTTGLAGILSHLFASRNPLTGTVTYYLRTSWDSNYDEEGSDPSISGKPKVITTSTGHLPVQPLEYTLVPEGTLYNQNNTYYEKIGYNYFEYTYSADKWNDDLENHIVYKEIDENDDEVTQIQYAGDYSINYDSWSIISTPITE